MKNKTLAMMLSVLLGISVMSATVFAGYYASDETGNTVPPDYIDDFTVSTEGVKLPENQSNESLTPDGNMTIIDDVLQSGDYFVTEEKLANKQFITLKSKNGNYFYLVIDRNGDTENVYFLNLVDEADLLALIEGKEVSIPTCSCTDKCVTGAIKTDCEVCISNMSGCVGKEKAEEAKPLSEEEPDDEPDKESDKTEDESSSSSAIIAGILLVAVGIGFAVYWFKLRNSKSGNEQPGDIDGDDDEEYEYEEDE